MTVELPLPKTGAKLGFWPEWNRCECDYGALLGFLAGGGGMFDCEGPPPWNRAQLGFGLGWTVELPPSLKEERK